MNRPGDATVIFHSDQGPITFHCTVAETLQEKHQGLRGVHNLAMNHGMLFIYDSIQPLVFTMTEMNIPLDIIFINDQLIITHIVKADIGQQNIKSNGPVQYVVEINQGLTEEFQITLGTTVEIIFSDK